ncbi:hypothetical protein ARMGADRAFT_503355 [Armillaria gallica]|uniref:Zinc finger PHD-type domain-containing protein n=1 Tax=Armillaria gallica TaxID=47427 RepID=A0A2H3EGN0_ARMGA|nr:hypothetical protein ARMGADRAFT_503355 [Armillaria gallica]
MSTRTTRARAALGSTPPSSSAPVKQPAKPKGRTDSAHKVTAHPEKENEKSGTKLKSTRTKVTKSKNVYCICRKGDDGTPMIQCAECTDWYHFSCVNLTENTAEDIGEQVFPRSPPSPYRYGSSNMFDTCSVVPIFFPPYHHWELC